MIKSYQALLLSFGGSPPTLSSLIHFFALIYPSWFSFHSLINSGSIRVLLPSWFSILFGGSLFLGNLPDKTTLILSTMIQALVEARTLKSNKLTPTYTKFESIKR